MEEQQEKILLEVSSQGPAPIKDFFCFLVTETEVIWRWWKISLRTGPHKAKPGELKVPHKEYLEDIRVQGQVLLVFGPQVLEYSKCLCQGEDGDMQSLPDSLFSHMVLHFDLEKATQFADTSERFKPLFSSEEFWEQTVRLHWDPMTPEIEYEAKDMGWKYVFFTKKQELRKN